MTRTLDKFDFMSVYKYMSELSKHITKESNDDINVIVLVSGSEGEETRMGVISTEADKLKEYLFRALVSIYEQEGYKLEKKNFKDFIHEMMKR